MCAGALTRGWRGLNVIALVCDWSVAMNSVPPDSVLGIGYMLIDENVIFTKYLNLISVKKS